MEKPGIEELLIGCVLDPLLLRQLRESPESVFSDYELSDRAREILTSPDERLLELLGESVKGQSTEGEGNESQTPAPQEQTNPVAAGDRATRMVSLPESRLALRVVPYAQQAAESADESPAVFVNYAGHLDPLPEGLELQDLPEVPTAATDGEQLPPLSVVVGVQPTVWTDDSGNRQITFSVSARLPHETALQQTNEPAEASAGIRLSPWPRDVDSPAVNAAAAQVREASSDERYQRLLELIDVMVAPTEAVGTEQ